MELKKLDWKTPLIWTVPGLAVVMVSALQGEIRYYWAFLSWLPSLALLAHLVMLKFPNKIQ